MTLTNEGKQKSLHWFELNYRSYAQFPPDQRYFHAQYRQATPPPDGPILILDATGEGHLIGCVLSIKNNDGGWWGEGDEIVYVDGKQTIQGTGSEDYFCQSYGLRRDASLIPESPCWKSLSSRPIAGTYPTRCRSAARSAS